MRVIEQMVIALLDNIIDRIEEELIKEVGTLVPFNTIRVKVPKLT